MNLSLLSVIVGIVLFAIGNAMSPRVQENLRALGFSVLFRIVGILLIGIGAVTFVL